MTGISYVTLGTDDLRLSRPFYVALMNALGGEIVREVPDRAFCCSLPDGGHVWVTHPFDGHPASPGNGAMTALSARSARIVDTAYADALAAGGTSEGAPGPRPQYGPGVYVAYLRDPAGNKLALVHYGAP